MSLIEQAAKRLEELRRAGVGEQELREEPLVRDAVTQSPREIERTDRALHNGNDVLGVKPSVKLAPASNTPRSVPSSMASSHRVEIDLAQLAAKNIVTPDDPRSRIADEFRVIKRPLLENAKGKSGALVKSGNLIMVTSCLPGEGKTFTAINLAMSIAMEMDNTVLLVDADVARPTVLKYFGLPPAKGLLDVLLHKDLDLGDVLLRTNVEKMSVLPGGTGYKHATELLASESMAELIGEVASRYPDRIIIFDSPPLLVTTEARVLATHMGQIVLVVEAEKTPHAAIRHALATIEACPLVMTMLNKSADPGGGGLSYGYGYGGYGYGGYGHAKGN